MIMRSDINRQKYETNEIVSYYERQRDLQPCEAYLFEKYLRPGLVILDIGVGGGRTTPHLANEAARYVGADYSEGMVEACRRRFPGIDFRHCDATDMSQFYDCEFDAVVFSFNGIDVIRTNEARARCIAETARVLKPGGVFIFSSHNARAFGVWPQLFDAVGFKIPWRIVRSVFKSVAVSARTLRSGAFRSGQGFVLDPVHGGMRHYVSVPDTIRPQIEAASLAIVEIVGGHYPHVTAKTLTPWYYYTCIKSIK